MLENTDAMRGVIAYNFGHNTWYNIYGGGFKHADLNKVLDDGREGLTEKA